MADIRNATVNYIVNGTWTNNHQNVAGPYQRFYNIDSPEDADETYILADFQAATVAFQEILRDALAAGQQLRLQGGTWSLSDAAYSSNWMLGPDTLGNYHKMQQNQVLPGYTNDIVGLWLVQSGVFIGALNHYLEYNNRALKTSGASNGQTVAGAIATGTHGSAYQYGAMPEYVVGLHLIPDPDKSVWLERASFPVITDDFAASLGMTIQRDDDLFNAALVSFGSFGIVAAVMIESDPIYWLETTSFMVNNDDTLHQAMTTMDLSQLNLPHPAETPWHFEVTFDPHNAVQGYAKVMYKRSSAPINPPPPPPSTDLAPGEGLLGIIGKFTNILPGFVVSQVTNLLLTSEMKMTSPTNPAQTLTPGATFSSTTTQGKAYSMEVGIRMSDAPTVLALLLSLSPELDDYTGVISYRWVKQSSAMLGFTKFPITTTIEFNAAPNDKTLAYYNRIWNALSSQGIAYTLHWGQMYDFNITSVRTMYTDEIVDKWIGLRQGFLSPAAQAVFSNDFLNSTGLG